MLLKNYWSCRVKLPPERRRSVVAKLIEVATQPNGFKSEAEFARTIGAGKQKLSNWKVGRAKAPPEFVSFALLLISLGSGAAIKQALEQRKDVLRSLEIGD